MGNKNNATSKAETSPTKRSHVAGSALVHSPFLNTLHFDNFPIHLNITNGLFHKKRHPAGRILVFRI